MGLLDSFPTYEKTKKKKNSAKKSSKTSGQKNRVEYRHRNSSKSSKATTKTKKQVSSAKKKAKSSASSSGRRNQVEYRHRDTDASSESSLLSKELPVAKERKENTERDTALTPKMNLPYGNPKKPTTSASSASPKGFGDFRVAQREQEKNQAKPLNLQYLSSAITGNTRKDQGTGQKNAVSTALSMPSFSAERKEDTNRNTAAKTIAGPVDVSLKTITELGHEGVKANAAGKRDKSLNLQYLSNEFVNNLLNQGTKRTSDTEKMYHPFDYEKIKEQSAMRRERAKEHREALWRNIEQGARSVQRTLNKNAYSILDSSDEIHGTNGRGPVPLSKQRELNDQARETASNFFEKDAKRNEQIAKDIEEGKISSFTSKVAQGFGQLAAESPFWALGGGLGTVAKGATKAAKVAGKIINSMASPSLPYYITSDYGDQYYQARQEGATREEANKSALLYAIPAAIAERLGGADAAATKAIGQRLGDNIVSSIIKSAASEGLEEAAQTSYGNLTRRTYKDVPLFSTNPEQDAVINPQQLAESAAVGAVLGGFSGGAIHGASNIVNRTSSRADRNDNQGTSADTTAADVGNSNIPVAPNEKRNSNHRPAGDVAPTGYTPEALNDTVKDMETIKREYQEAVDPGLVKFYNDVQRKNVKRTAFYPLGFVSQRAGNDIYNLIGINPTGYKVEINPSAAEHIEQRHGKNGKADKSMKDINDIARMKYVLDNYDDMTIGQKSHEWRNSDGTYADTVIYSKRVNGNYYIVEAVSDNKRKIIHIVSAYKNKADQQVPDTPMGPQGDARNELPASAFNNSIPDSAGNSNPLYTKRSEDIHQLLSSRLQLPSAREDDVFASVNSIPDPAENINPRNEENNTNLNEWGVEDDGEKVARITTETQRERTKIRQVAQEAQDMFTRAWVNSGYAIDRLADTSGNQNLKYRYNNVGQSPRTIESMVIQNQSDFNGRNVGKSINDIFKPIIEKGDEYYEDFQEYLFHKHNIDRMTLEHKTNGEVKNKPVFGKSVDAENSELVVQTYDQTNPEFKELAEDIYNYNRNLMQYRVDSGLISREQADTLLERYPYYVPTYRAGGQSNTGSFRQSGRRFGVDSTIARAKGSDMDLAPLHEQMVDQTAAVVYNGRINKLLNDIYDSLPPEQKNLALEENTGYDVDSETLDGTGVQPFRVVGNQVAFYRDGKKVTMEVDDGIAYGLRELIPKGNNIAKQFFGGINNAFKSLITTYNPIFVLTNGVRDAGDAALYSANVQGFAKKYPKAWAEIVTDSERFKIYKSLGGFGASRFDDGGNRNYKEHGAVRKYTVDMIEAANYTVEQAPRYAEFLNVLERIKRERGDRTPLTEDLREFSGDDLQKALYAAADITVNFGRGGKWGKLVNAYAVPFFNAAAQGTSRYVRNITKGVRENEGNKAAQVAVVSKNVGSLVLKAAFLGIGGRLLGELMYGDDEEYQEMNERDKSLNFIIKDPTGGDLSGGTGWIRIPVGRAVSFTNDVINRVFHTGKSMYEMATDGKDASASEVLGTLSDQWSGLTAIASETVAPSNPFGENSRIDRPFSNVFLQGTDRNDNKMWNGMPVESQEFENTPINERYNERTTATSKALGNLKIGNKTFSEITGLSPQEMDYLGDSYLGTIWDFATPALTPYAEDNPFKKKFTVDPVMQNRLSSDFYKLKQQAAYKSNNNTESAAGIVSSYYNRVAGEVGQINNQISKIQNSATLSDKEKQTRTRDLREQINGLYRDAIKNEQAYGKAAERNFAELGDKKLAQFKTDKDVFGAEYAIGHYNKDIKEKADFLERKGVSYDDFYNIYFDNVRISKENKKTASYQVERLKTESFLSNSQSLSDDNFGYVANAMGLLNDDSYRKAQNLNHTVNLSYRDFFTAKRQASYIDGEINSRGKQYPGEASDSKRALVMELDDLDGGQQVSLANALGCFSDSQVTKAQTALEEAGIDMKEYFKVYTEVNRIKNQGGTTIEQRKAISDTGLTSQQKIYLNLALSTMTEREASLASVATSLGISDNDFYVIFTNLNGFEADKDANGKSVSGSLRKKSMAYIDSMPISNEQKNFFFNTVAGYSGSPRWGNINFGKQGKGIASFSESELTVDNEGNPINQPTAETASTTSLTPVQQAIHNMMGSFVEKIHQHPETKAISAAITAANAVSSGLSHTPNTNALQQAIWAPFFARVYGDQAASPQEEQSAFTGVTEDNGRFPAEIINAAMQSQIEDGIPAAITLAQWAQESGYGAHMPANSNNPFGITAGRGWTGKTVQGNNAAGTDPATYRVYDSLADAFKDHAAVLKNGYYDIDGLDVSDVDGWIGALQGVYATDPNYGNALRQIIEDNHLSQYTEMAKQYSASSLSAASAPNTIYSPVDISKINTGYPFGAPKTGGRSGTHKGTDFSVPTGTPVTAVADGIVIKAGSNGSAYGNSVLVDMGNGYYYQFNHLSDWGVKAGDTVKAGDIICKSGNTGSNNTGAHLEIEVYQGSPDYGNQIDPVAYFGWGDAEPGTVIHSTDSGNYQSQGGSSGNGSGGSGSSSGSTSQGRGYSSSGIPYAYDGSLYRSSNYRNSRTSLAGNGGRYSFEGRSLPAYQYMGPRNDLFTGNSPAPTESKGKVVYAAPDNGVNRVVVDNGDGTYTSYRNVGEINVKRGDYADESTILAGTNPDQVEVEIIQGNFLINNNDLQAYSRQLGA